MNEEEKLRKRNTRIAVLALRQLIYDLQHGGKVDSIMASHETEELPAQEGDKWKRFRHTGEHHLELNWTARAGKIDKLRKDS